MTVVVEDKIFTLDDWQYGQDSARGGLLAGSRLGGRRQTVAVWRGFNVGFSDVAVVEFVFCDYAYRL